MLNKVFNIGVRQGQSPARVKSIRTLNGMSFVTILMVLLFSATGIVLQVPKAATISVLSLNILFIAILQLNAKGYNFIARVIYLSASYLIIFVISICFGPNSHFQYFLVPGVGMSLLFFSHRRGAIKWFFVLVGLPIFLIIELWNLRFDPIIAMDPSALSIIRIFADFATLCTSIVMFYFFASNANRQLSNVVKQKRTIEEKNEELEDFSFVVSHDLKAPLNSIIGLVELLKVKLNKPSDDVKKTLGVLEESTERMRSLISDILAYSSAGSDKDSRVTLTADEFQSIVVSDFEREKVQFNFNIEPQQLTINATQIKQVFNNLISNALKYAETDNLAITIELSTTSKFYNFSFADNGKGLDLQEKEKLFHLFYTGSQPKSFESSGIGLAIVNKLVKKNGGEIKIDKAFTNGLKYNFTWSKSGY